MKTRLLAGMAFAAIMAVGVAADTVIDKPPDQGPYWHPLSNSGTYVYADNFIAPDTDTIVDKLGIWLNPEGGGTHSVIALQLWGGGDAGPDWTDVIASTDDFQAEEPGLNLYVLPVTSGGGPLTPGDRYWLIATAVDRGDPSYGSYQVGGHTQNSVYQDDGTFWYSNDPLGHNFDGRNLTPEMAFQVYLIPEPATAGLLGLALLGLVRRR